MEHRLWRMMASPTKQARMALSAKSRRALGIKAKVWLDHLIVCSL